MTIEKSNLDIPKYLNKEFFKSTLKSETNSSNVEIKSLHFTKGCSGGDNYCSFIYRVEIVYCSEGSSVEKQISLIVKSIPFDGAREIFAKLNIYTKEKLMYLDILPKMEDCLDNVKLAPKFYYTTAVPVATIVFEDMKMSGYNVSDRVNGLDEEHCKIILNKLGKYHAASLLYLGKDPRSREIDILRTGVFSSVSMAGEIFQKSYKAYLTILAEHCSTWPGYEEITKKLRNLRDGEFVEKCLQTTSISCNDIVVLNHGDMWVNNFLFKYKENSTTPSDAVLIDFQGSFYGSLGLDINYLIYTSPNLDLLINKKFNLIQSSYYTSFKNTLIKGDYKQIPSWGDIKNEIRKKAFYGFFSAICVLPVISMSKEDSSDNSIENLKDEQLAAQQLLIACSSKRYLDTMQFLLKEFDRIGIID